MISDAERAALERLGIPLALCSIEDGHIHAELVSDGQCAYFGLTRPEMLNALRGGMYSYTHPEDGERLVKATEDFLFRRRESLDIVFRNRVSEDAEYHLNLAVSRWQVMADGSEYAMLIYLDLSGAESGVSNILALYGQSPDDILYRDINSELPNMNFNRQFADQRIAHFRSMDQTPMLMDFDVKGMQTYNQNYGYTNGDRFIQLVARTLKEVFPGGTVIRGQDDDFLVYDAFTDEATVRRQVDRVNSLVRTNAYGSTMGLRAGVCVITPEMRAVNALDCARTALAEIAADLNKVCAFYAPERDEQYWMRRYIVDTFDRALEQHWIKVFYQPIVRTRTRKMTVLESLARWIDPGRGVIPPGDFIPLLSRFHLLYRLDLYMVEEVCREFETRAEVGLPLLPVSVNFSAQDFDHANVPEELDRILASYDVARTDIIIEITEQDIAQGTDHFKNQLRELRSRGYRLWIDDFGSGYSSLSVFSQFDIDRIKFDMNLLQNLDDMDGANRRILRAFVGVCREMGVHTLCEGVETQAQLEFLQEIDCEMAQGYFFYKPNPLEDAVFRVKHSGKTTNFETREERTRICAEWLRAGGRDLPEKCRGCGEDNPACMERECR